MFQIHQWWGIKIISSKPFPLIQLSCHNYGKISAHFNWHFIVKSIPLPCQNNLIQWIPPWELAVYKKKIKVRGRRDLIAKLELRLKKSLTKHKRQFQNLEHSTLPKTTPPPHIHTTPPPQPTYSLFSPCSEKAGYTVTILSMFLKIILWITHK